MITKAPTLTPVQRETVVAYLRALENRIAVAAYEEKHATVERLTDKQDAIDIALSTCDAGAAGHATQFTQADLTALKKALPNLSL
jgi:hypothetical protein